ncbi:RNA polymerase, sigma-24 subunit, ECF subfamily [Sphingobium chlorophenolicum L-1]|uniref:RNA polymerase, sigma-24 subunit, ECF subfamily n=1 Tax=Sphingobium chlorophenolicum L-1 TaxID=690566 RepID=F6F1W3_SPHCR|nr:sigma-70 family RNA polymerase sigma factor [Sphingobium chlorophenolicum]AEG51529.1 RNA polymerase, sigma-24 subunit, ECF subfamily [Sphingobium chlorophenolicum L-1]
MSTNAIALTRLLLRERSSLLRVAERILRDRPAAEDVTQSLWLRIQRVEDHPRIVNKRAYLYRLATNLAADHRRAARRHETLIVECDTAEQVPCTAPSAERRMLDREQVARLMKAVDELPPRCREVFVLRKLENMSVHEICAKLGISRSMVARHMDNALRRCFDRMQEPGG